MAIMYDPYLIVEYAYDYNLEDDVLGTTEGTMSPQRDADTLDGFNNSTGWAITRVIIFSFAVVTIIIANVLLLVVIRKVRYLKTSSNRYVVTLAVADIVMGLYTILKIIEVVSPDVQQNIYFCLCLQLGWICVAMVSQILMLYLTFDCYFSLWHPISYNQLLTSCKANFAILMVWVYAGVVALIPLAWIRDWTEGACYMEDVILHRYLLFFLLHFCIAVLVVIIVFLFVYYEIRTSKVVLKVYKKRKKQRQVYEERRKKDVQNAQCMTIVVILYFVFWIPYYIILSINMYYARNSILTLLETIAVIIVILHSCVNPAIYVCKLHTFQIACYKVMCCFFARHFPSRPPSDNVQLRSLSFRNHATGSMMSLHTTIGNEGKIVRVPQLIVSDYDKSIRGNHRSVHYNPTINDNEDVWCVPDSPDMGLVRGELYRSKNKHNHVYSNTAYSHGPQLPHSLHNIESASTSTQNTMTVPVEHHL